MKKKTRRVSLAVKHIRRRVQEIELSKHVHEVKEPAHLENLSFEKKMRRRMDDEHWPRKRRKRECCETAEEQKEEKRNEKNKIEEKQIEKETEEKESTAYISEKKKIFPVIDIPVKSPLKKMKCGCLSHGPRVKGSVIPGRDQESLETHNKEKNKYQ